MIVSYLGPVSQGEITLEREVIYACSNLGSTVAYGIHTTKSQHDCFRPGHS